MKGGAGLNCLGWLPRAEQSRQEGCPQKPRGEGESWAGDQPEAGRELGGKHGTGVRVGASKGVHMHRARSSGDSV